MKRCDILNGIFKEPIVFIIVTLKNINIYTESNCIRYLFLRIFYRRISGRFSTNGMTIVITLEFSMLSKVLGKLIECSIKMDEVFFLVFFKFFFKIHFLFQGINSFTTSSFLQ